MVENLREFFGANEFDSGSIVRNGGKVAVDILISNEVHHLVGSIAFHGCIGKNMRLGENPSSQATVLNGSIGRTFVVVAAIKVTTVLCPMILYNFPNRYQRLSWARVFVSIHQN
jgi:hypothetical protein